MLRTVLFLIVGSFISAELAAATIAFQGTLGVIDVDEPGATYAGSPLGQTFNGEIDDVTFDGFISDGTTTTPFNCCDAAGGIAITNDLVLSAGDVAFLNGLAGSNAFAENETVDLVDIEGDGATPSGGRIEVGLSYVLTSSAFSNDDISNYPFNPSDVRLALFFIVEEDNAGLDVYDAVGAVTPVPLPAALIFAVSGMLGIFIQTRRGKKNSTG